MSVASAKWPTLSTKRVFVYFGAGQPTLIANRRILVDKVFQAVPIQATHGGIIA